MESSLISIVIILSVLVFFSFVTIIILVVTSKKKVKLTQKNMTNTNESVMINNEEYVKSFAVIANPSRIKNEQSERAKNFDSNATVGLARETSSRKKDIFSDRTESIMQPKKQNNIKNNNSNISVMFKYIVNGYEKYFEMEGGISIIGRDHNQCDIVVEHDKYIGSVHLIVINKNNKVFVGDLNSKNGTTIGGESLNGLLRITGNTTVKIASTNIEILLK